MAAPAAAAAVGTAPDRAFLQFAPVGVQPPLCRLFQHSTADRSCPHTAEECPHLHVKEEDTSPGCTYQLDALSDAAQLAAAMRGVPFILYRLAPGEEASFSLLRRTLEQHGDWVRRGRNVRHALLHWTQSRPSSSMAPLMRPDCRVLHFQHFCELTHKHRWQSCVRKQRAKLAVIADAMQSTDPVRAHRLRHVLDFYPTTLLLPSDRLQLLQLHESLGGQVDEQLREEALHPSRRSYKAERKEKRRNAVGDVVIRSAEPPSSSSSPSPSPSASASPPALEGGDDGVDAPSSSPPAAAGGAEDEAPLWLSFELPDFLAEFPLHFAAAAPPAIAAPTAPAADSSAASSADAVATPVAAVAAPGSVSAPASPPIWILKPYSRGSGHGIRVTDLMHNVRPEWITGQFVATSYVQRPLLIDRTAAAAAVSAASASAPAPVPSQLRKFDLRLYVLLMSPYFPGSPSVSSPGERPPFPYQVFLHEEGLARFASAPYAPDSLAPASLGTRMDAYTHLTNSSVNISNGGRAEKERGCWENWSMATLKRHFDQQRAALDARTRGASSAHPDIDPAGAAAAPVTPYAWSWSYVWAQVRHAVVHSVCASDCYLRSGLDEAMAHTFELLGFDILIDENFRVHLCEINSMPDLNSSTPLMQYHHTYPVDHEVKSHMLADLFTALRFDAPPPPTTTTATAPHAIDAKDSNGLVKGAPSSAAATPRNIGGFERLI